jgi:hypothetical protein
LIDKRLALGGASSNAVFEQAQVRHELGLRQFGHGQGLRRWLDSRRTCQTGSGKDWNQTKSQIRAAGAFHEQFQGRRGNFLFLLCVLQGSFASGKSTSFTLSDCQASPRVEIRRNTKLSIDWPLDLKFPN